MNPSEGNPSMESQHSPQITTTADINKTNEDNDQTGASATSVHASGNSYVKVSDRRKPVQAQFIGAFPKQTASIFKERNNVCQENQEVYTSLCESIEASGNPPSLMEKQPLLDVNALQTVDTDVTLTGEGELLGPVTGATKTSDWVVEV